MKAAYQFEVLIDGQPAQVFVSQDSILQALREGAGYGILTLPDTIVRPLDPATHKVDATLRLVEWPS